MKTSFKHRLSSPVICSIAIITAGHLHAQTYSAVCDLPDYNDGPPDLLLSSNTLYGVSPGNGLEWFGHVGDVWKVNPDGSGFWGLYVFDSNTPGEGYLPCSGMILAGNTFYGTAARGGLGFPNGTVFSLNMDGTGRQDIYQFTGGADGSFPFGGLVVNGNTLFGTTAYGGISGNGTVFKVNADGTGFTTLYTFSGVGTPNPGAPVTNSDGAYPQAQLVLSGSTLYGTARGGGTGASGTVFALNTDGTGFTNLHNFEPVDPTAGTNHDGAGLTAPLILSGNTLFSTASSGGTSSNGTVFKLNIDGTDFSVLHTFAPTTGNGSYSPTNSDGIGPGTRLFLSTDTLYGTTFEGGAWGYGTVFAIKTDGTGFRLVKTFLGAGDYSHPGDGANPTSGLLRVGNALYGCVNSGSGNNAEARMYRLAFAAPPLSITRSGGNVVLRWPTIYGGYEYSPCTLQSATDLDSPVWVTSGASPVVVDGINTIAIPISGNQQFFRLIP